jgi:hypothetical protein
MPPEPMVPRTEKAAVVSRAAFHAKTPECPPQQTLSRR